LALFSVSGSVLLAAGLKGVPVIKWNWRLDFVSFNVTLRRRKFNLSIDVAAACRDK
jgi:hypothetical protein